jgi:hypothetical protein
MEQYEIQLQRLASGDLSATQRTVVSQLIDLLRIAGEKGAALTASDFGFRGDAEHDFAQTNLKKLVNQACLGFGNDGARFVFMGTEEGYKVEDAEFWNLAVGNFAYAVSWATGGKDDVLGKIAGKDAGTYQGSVYHRHPYDYYELASTWLGIARCLGSISGRGWRSYFDPADGASRLGDLVYVIDRSGVPSKSAPRGSAPTPERESFLRDVVSSLRQTARVLVITGSTGSSASDEWARINRDLTSWFLRTTESHSRSQEVGRARLRCFDANGLRVIWTWALGGAAPVGSDYFRAVGDWISEADQWLS